MLNDLLNSMTLRQKVGRTMNWARYLANRSTRRGRFVPLTPPFLKHQRLFDRTTGQTLSLWIRDDIDHLVLSGVFLNRDYEFPHSRDRDIRGFYEAQVRAGTTPLIIDCGANSGMATRYYRETYPGAYIVAVEPDARNIQAARKNNPDTVGDFLLAGIGCETSRVTIANKDDANWAYRTRESADGDIGLVTVNKILEAHSDKVPFIIKIDIEGFEDNLFAKHTEWIEKFPALVIELHDWMLPKAGSSRNFLRETARQDRDFICRGENIFSISNTLI